MNPQAHIYSLPPGTGTGHFVALGAQAAFGTARREA